MIEFFSSVVFALLMAVPLTVALALAYCFLAYIIVNIFGLNRNGDGNMGFRVLNWTILISFISYFFAFAAVLNYLK